MKATHRDRIGKNLRARKTHLLRRAAVETLEQRMMLTDVPAFVHMSAGANVTVTGSAGNLAINASSGSVTFDADLSSAGTDWQNPTVNFSGTAIGVFNICKPFIP